MTNKTNPPNKNRQKYIIVPSNTVGSNHQHLPPTNSTKASYDLARSLPDVIDRNKPKYASLGYETIAAYTKHTALQQHVSRVQINSAKNKSAIISLINNSGQNAIAERLLYLDKLPISKPDDKPITLESLRGFASFIIDRWKVLKPRISISPDGLVNAEWDKDNGTLAMEFSEMDRIRFAAIFYSESTPQHTSGVLSIDNMTEIHKSLIKRFGLQ